VGQRDQRDHETPRRPEREAPADLAEREAPPYQLLDQPVEQQGAEQDDGPVGPQLGPYVEHGGADQLRGDHCRADHACCALHGGDPVRGRRAGLWPRPMPNLFHELAASSRVEIARAVEASDARPGSSQAGSAGGTRSRQVSAPPR
jgi:hypothetical protein